MVATWAQLRVGEKVVWWVGWRVLGWVESKADRTDTYRVATSVDSWVASLDRQMVAMTAAKTVLMMVDFWVQQ